MVKIKRALALALAMAMCLALISCGSSDTAEEEHEVETTVEAELEEEIPEHEYTVEDLDGLISGVANKGFFTTENETDLIEDIEWDEDIIQSITLNEDEIDLSTEGKYDAVYTVTAYQNPLDYHLGLTDEIATLDEEMPEDYVTIDIDIDTTVYVLDESNSGISDIAILLGADVDLSDVIEFNEEIFESLSISEGDLDSLAAGEYEIVCTVVANKDALDSYFEASDGEADEAELSTDAKNETKTDSEELSSSPEGKQTDEELSSVEEVQPNQTNENDAVETESDTDEGEQEGLSSFEETETVEFTAAATVYVVPEEGAMEWLSDHTGYNIFTNNGIYEAVIDESEGEEDDEETLISDTDSAAELSNESSTDVSSSNSASTFSATNSGSGGSKANSGTSAYSSTASSTLNGSSGISNSKTSGNSSSTNSASSSSSKSSTSSTTTCSHSYGNGKITKSATCTSTGIKTYTCTKCGATKTESIAKTDHTWEAVSKTVHHDEEGHYETVTESEYIYGYVCTSCGYANTDLGEMEHHILYDHSGKSSYKSGYGYTEPYEHQKWIVDKAAYDEQVVDYYKCSVCGAIK